METSTAVMIGMTMILIIALVILFSLLYNKRTTPRRPKMRYKVSSLKRVVEDKDEE